MHVIATAGHVDHGKSTLVRALTGIEPDRWAEERRRGLTIDLGYAWTQLPDAGDVAFVDVPGHERFIANMLAGVGPAAAVLFVVAADSGWSRQSEEHLHAIDALGLRHGLLAVTRSDLADPAPALDQARERVARSSLGAVAGVAVSGATGAGLEEMRAALGGMLTAMPRPDPDTDVRLWLDRSFSVRGSGTVVTATLAAGRVRVGDDLELRGGRVSVRGIESLGVARDCVTGPARVALNLRGVDRQRATRGDTLLTPGAWHLTSSVDVALDLDADGERIASELMLHVGTAAVPVHLRPLGAGTARLTLDTALPLRAGDRAVLRDPGRQVIVAGVQLLDADPPALRRRGAARARGDELAAGRPTALEEVGRRGVVSRAHLRRLGVGVPEGGAVHPVGGWLVSDSHWEGWVARARAAARSWAAAHPLQPQLPLPALRDQLGVPDDPALVSAVVRAAGLQSAAGGVQLPGQGVGLAPGITDLVDRLTREPFAAPERAELAALRLGRRELAAAERAGMLVRLAEDIVLRPQALDDAVARLAELAQPFTTSQARQALGSTRRVVVPLLEHLDRLGRTERVDPTTRRIALQH